MVHSCAQISRYNSDLHCDQGKVFSPLRLSKSFPVSFLPSLSILISFLNLEFFFLLLPILSWGGTSSSMMISRCKISRRSIQWIQLLGIRKSQMQLVDFLNRLDMQEMIGLSYLVEIQRDLQSCGWRMQVLELISR